MGLEFLEEFFARVDVVLFVDSFDVLVDGGVTDVQRFGDLVVGVALEEERQDLLAARRWGAVQAWAVFAFAVGGEGEVFWFGDLAAVEEAGGDVGDELVPTVAVEAREEGDAVAEVTGEF